MKNFLTVVFLFVINFSHSQSLIKYVDFDDAIQDLKKNGIKSSYFEVVHPSNILYLNCEYYDFMRSLYTKSSFDNIGKEDYCFRDSTQIKEFNFSAKSFREIFDDDLKTKTLLRKMPDIEYDNDINVSIHFPIYLYQNQALITFYFSNGSAVYRLTLLNNQIKYELCTSIIE
jgi:hypothetical protein